MHAFTDLLLDIVLSVCHQGLAQCHSRCVLQAHSTHRLEPFSSQMLGPFTPHRIKSLFCCFS